MSELKPCPFCGGEAEVERWGDNKQSHMKLERQEPQGENLGTPERSNHEPTS